MPVHILQRRFLRARKFDIKNSKIMLSNCQHWRKTVEGVGLDALYDQIDPFDVSHNIYKIERHSQRYSSTQNEKPFSSIGHCFFTRSLSFKGILNTNTVVNALV